MTPPACLMDRILAPGGLRARFQPIFEWNGKRFRARGVEGLVSGPRGSNVQSAEVLFDYVRRKRQEAAVDRACVERVLDSASGLPPGLDLSVNVHAATLSKDDGFASFLLRAVAARRIPTSRVTIEIVEHAPDWAGPVLLRTLGTLREGGFRIALDDVGQGRSNYRMIVDTRPDYLKMDRYFVRGLPHDHARQAVLHSVAVLAARLGGQVLLEGVERREELDAALSLGISLFQGFFFSPAVECERLPQLARGRGGLANGRNCRRGADGLQ